jgi:hypothetical protein
VVHQGKDRAEGVSCPEGSMLKNVLCDIMYVINKTLLRGVALARLLGKKFNRFKKMFEDKIVQNTLRNTCISHL